jgi:hypothetical protein
MTAYDLHSNEVNFQLVSAHHALKELTRRFGGEILIDTIKRFEVRDEHIAKDPERTRAGSEHVLQ